MFYEKLELIWICTRNKTETRLSFLVNEEFLEVPSDVRYHDRVPKQKTSDTYFVMSWRTRILKHRTVGS